MNKMKVLAAALAVAGIGTAHAQASVQVYGIIDTAIEYRTNVNAAGDNLTRMPDLSGGMIPSRIGFRGTEDLGGGLKAIFTLENGFAPDSGMLGQGNRLFGRQAWVGLSGSWGAVTVGRNYSMLFHSFLGIDHFGPSLFSFGAWDSYLGNFRSDNSIAYKGTFSGVTLGATYSLGRDASAAGGPGGTNCGGENPADRKACRNWSIMARYDGPGWGAVAAHDTYNGGAGAAAPFGPTSSNLSDSRTHVAAYVRFEGWKVGGGWMHRNNEGNALTPKSNLTYLTAAYNVTPAFLIDAQVARQDIKDSPNAANLYVLRGTYSLSKRTAVYVSAGHVSNDGTAALPLAVGGTVAPGGSQNGVLTGIQHVF